MKSQNLTKSWFLIDFIADFNRQINVKAYTKIINGKAIAVSPSQRRLLRLKDALTDLRRRGGKAHEGGYFVPTVTGKISRYIPGSENSVDVGIHPKQRSLSFLHNHPNHSGLSLGDLVSASESGISIHAVTPRGSWYRAKVMPNLESYLKKPSQFKRRQNELVEIFLTSKENSSTGFRVDEKQWDNASLAAQHAFLLDLKKHKLIEYRAKMTPKDKQVIKFYEPEITAYLNRDWATDYKHG